MVYKENKKTNESFYIIFAKYLCFIMSYPKKNQNNIQVKKMNVTLKTNQQVLRVIEFMFMIKNLAR